MGWPAVSKLLVTCPLHLAVMAGLVCLELANRNVIKTFSTDANILSLMARIKTSHHTAVPCLKFAVDMYFDRSPLIIDPYMECKYITVCLVISVCTTLVTFHFPAVLPSDLDSPVTLGKAWGCIGKVRFFTGKH